jgi:predicted ATP-grasp superfamily ATP-dependent carboligase
MIDDLARHAGGPVAAAVCCAETYNALAVLRSLGRRGIPVTAFAPVPDAVGFSSRYVRRAIRHPDVATDPAGFIRALRAFGAEQRAQGIRTVVFSNGDRIIEALSAARDEIGNDLELFLPAAADLDALLDKRAQYRVAEEIGVPFPKTYLRADVARLWDDLASGATRLPLMLKTSVPVARADQKSFRRMVLETEAAARATLADADALDVPFVVQAFIPGGDDSLYTVGAAMDSRGVATGLFTGRKLRQMPPRIGICRVGESLFEPELAEMAVRLLRAMRFRGIAQVEFKRDPRDGSYRLMEINPRSWSWIGLPVAVGADLPFAAFCGALGMELPPADLPSKRRLWISLTDDLDRSLQHRDGLPWRHLFVPPRRFVEAYFAADDPKPALIHYARFADEFGGRFIRKIFGLAGCRRKSEN